jgi:hypothetical protein
MLVKGGGEDGRKEVRKRDKAAHPALFKSKFVRVG